MGAKLSDYEYGIIDRYMAEVLRRFRDDHKDLTEAHEDIMHPLTAFIEGNAQEFIPYMELCLDEWEGL